MHAQFSNFSPTGGALDNEEVYASASETNYRNQGIARLLQSFGRIYFDPAEAIDHPSTQMGYLNSRSLGVGLAFSPPAGFKTFCGTVTQTVNVAVIWPEGFWRFCVCCFRRCSFSRKLTAL
jgi:hypothetical protein